MKSRVIFLLTNNFNPLKSYFVMKIKLKITKYNSLLLLSITLACFLCACASPDAKKAAFCSKGKKLLAQGEALKAKLEFRNALQIDPEFAEAHYLLGSAELKLKNLKTAFKQFSAAVERDPDHVDAMISMAKMLFSGKAYERALEYAEKVIALEPANETANLFKAAILITDKKPEPARRRFEKIEKHRWVS